MANLEAAPAADLNFSTSSVYTYWKDFDLDGRRSKLDEIGLKIAGLQEQSTVNRKKLADSTREFKRSSANSSSAADCAAAAGNLLKQYQEEIDALTRRAKHGEGAFLDLYQLLFEAPDPSPVLALAVDNEAQLSQLTTQVQKVCLELAEYKAESKAIKNQDLTIRKQEEVIRELTAALEAKDQELIDSRKQAAAEADAAVLQRMQAREAELSDMLASAQCSLEAMKRLYTTAQNQLFELQSTKEEAAVGRQEEVELAAAELEAVQARLLALETEKRNLQEKLEASRHDASAAAEAGEQGSAGGTSLEETLRQELNNQREVSARLRQDLAASRQSLLDTVAQWEDQHAALQQQLEQQTAAAVQLQHELRSRPTAAQMQELQLQLHALQAVGYGSVEELPPAASVGNADGSAAAAVGAAAFKLEGMLLAKNRRLEHEVTMAKLAVAESSQELAATKEQVSELQDQLQQKSDLVAQLEEDILAIRQGSVQVSWPASTTLTPRGAASLTGQASEALSPAPSTAAPAAVDDEFSEDNAMLRVMVGQRDRLRQRVQELEVQLASTKAELHQSQHDLAAARADNVALVERLRYVGGYRQQAAAARNNAAAASGTKGDVESGADVVGKYSQIYDAGINPFKEFQGQQREQKRKQMGVADKAMYSVGSLVYQSPAARLLTFGYIVILHLLVFMSLTHMTHRTSGHIMDHQELVLQHRHDLTSLLHQDGGLYLRLLLEVQQLQAHLALLLLG